MITELDICKNIFYECNGRPIFLESASISILEPLPAQYKIDNLDPLDCIKNKEIFCSGKYI